MSDPEPTYRLRRIAMTGPEGHELPDWLRHRAALVSKLFEKMTEVVPNPCACSDEEFDAILDGWEKEIDHIPNGPELMLKHAAVTMLTLERIVLGTAQEPDA